MASMSKAARILSTIALFLFGCTAAVAPAGLPAPEADLMNADREQSRQVSLRRLEAWVEGFDASGAKYTNGKIVTGLPAIRESMAAAFADPNFTIEWAPTVAHVTSNDKMGVTKGRWKTRTMPNGREQVATGDYITVWRKQPDGSWKVMFDVGQRDPR
jgi:hypothetical protein